MYFTKSAIPACVSVVSFLTLYVYAAPASGFSHFVTQTDDPVTATVSTPVAYPETTPPLAKHIVVPGEWSTGAARQHYPNAANFPITLQIPAINTTECEVSGDGLTTIYCACHLAAETGFVDGCIAMLNITSSDLNAPPLPSIMVVQWLLSNDQVLTTHQVAGYQGHGAPLSSEELARRLGGFSVQVENSDSYSASPTFGQQLLQTLGNNHMTIHELIKAFPTCVETPAQCSLVPEKVTARSIDADIGSKVGSRAIGHSPTSDNNVISIPAGWITDNAKKHYNKDQMDMALTLTWTAGAGLTCNFTGSGIGTKWCYCSLDANHQPKDCNGIALITSTDPTAPVLPQNMWVWWTANDPSAGINKGICGWWDEPPPAEISDRKDLKDSCKGFTLFANGFQQRDVASWPRDYVTQLMDPKHSLSWDKADFMNMIQNHINECAMDLKKCPAPITPQAPVNTRLITQPGNGKRHLSRGISTRSPKGNILTLQAGWITDSMKTHYQTDKMPLTLMLAYDSGLNCSFGGTGINTDWCHCSADENHLIKDCAGVANIASNDPGAPALPKNMYIRWLPAGDHPTITQGICGHSEVGLTYLKSCEGFRFVFRDGHEERNIGGYPPESISTGINPAFALALDPSQGATLAQDELAECSQDKNKCPTPVSLLPIQAPSGGLKVKRDDSSNTLTLQAGWITDNAKNHYNTAKINLNLVVSYNNGLSCQLQADGMTTRYCFCKTDPATQLLDDCAAIGYLTSPDPSAPSLPPSFYVRWRSRLNPGVIGGMCGYSASKGDKHQCDGFAFINSDNSPVTNVISQSDHSMTHWTYPRYALAWDPNKSMSDTLNGFPGIIDCTANNDEHHKCPTQVPTLPIQSSSTSWKYEDNPY